jgi:alkylation response protein AidB-like acyl-CoA dehydrogenase
VDVENVPKKPGFLLPLTFLEVGTEQQLDFLREWQHKLWSAGFLGMHWPTEYGGQGADPAYQGIVDKALGAHNAPIIFNTIGLNWTGPLLLDVGTEEDRKRYVKNILTGEEIWCQGFSEPDHGSDLGNVQTRAVRDGDEFIVNGSKIWTTLGNYADHMILLARTDTSTARKYDGLSFFLAPMKVAGVEARPIRKVTGEYGFNETFFTDARIPASCLLGDEGGGWRMAMKTLEYERGVIAGQASAHSMQSIGLEDLMDAMHDFERDGAPILEDAMIRDELVKLAIEAKANSISDRRAGIPCTEHRLPLRHCPVEQVPSHRIRAAAQNDGCPRSGRARCALYGRREGVHGWILAAGLLCELRNHHWRGYHPDSSQHHWRARARPA